MNPVRVGVTIPVRVVDGVPQCPWHGDEPMVQSGDGWQCPDAVALASLMRPVLLAAIDAVLGSA